MSLEQNGNQDLIVAAIDRINQGTTGDVDNSNAEVLAARRILDKYINSGRNKNEIKSRQEIINRALGIDVIVNETDMFINTNGHNKTGIITPTSYGTGLPRQAKRPRDLG